MTRLGMSCLESHDEMKRMYGDEAENIILRCGARVGAYIMRHVNIHRIGSIPFQEHRRWAFWLRSINNKTSVFCSLPTS